MRRRRQGRGVLRALMTGVVLGMMLSALFETALVWGLA